jgi:hypothetical protein
MSTKHIIYMRYMHIVQLMSTNKNVKRSFYFSYNSILISAHCNCPETPSKMVFSDSTQGPTFCTFYVTSQKPLKVNPSTFWKHILPLAIVSTLLTVSAQTILLAFHPYSNIEFWIVPRPSPQSSLICTSPNLVLPHGFNNCLTWWRLSNVSLTQTHPMRADCSVKLI